MKESFYLVKKKEAIKILENYPSEYVMLSEINYLTGKLDCKSEKISKSDGKLLVGQAASTTFMEDCFFSKLDLHSILQTDVRNIKRDGIVKSLLLANIKKGENL